MKTIYEYLIQCTEFTDKYEVKMFYIMHSFDYLGSISEWLNNVDFFIYQHTSVAGVKGNAAYTTDNLIKKYTFKKCISIASLYFSGYFPEPIKSSIPYFQTNATEFNGIIRTFEEIIPNYSMCLKIFALLRMGLSSQEIIDTVNKCDFMQSVVTEWNLYNCLNELNKREIENKVDIPVHNYIRHNFTQVRLFHTTNHPTKYMFAYILQYLCPLLDIPIIDAISQQDKMENVTRMFILECVLKHYQIDKTHPSFSFNDCVILGKKMTSSEYLIFLNQIMN